MIIFEWSLLVATQHSKAMAGDHGLNGDGDAIVMGLQGARGPAAFRMSVKMSNCIAGPCL
jgi:hypothetical protein